MSKRYRTSDTTDGTAPAVGATRSSTQHHHTDYLARISATLIEEILNHLLPQHIVGLVAASRIHQQICHDYFTELQCLRITHTNLCHSYVWHHARQLTSIYMLLTDNDASVTSHPHADMFNLALVELISTNRATLQRIDMPDNVDEMVHSNVMAAIRACSQLQHLCIGAWTGEGDILTVLVMALRKCRMLTSFVFHELGMLDQEEIATICNILSDATRVPLQSLLLPTQLSSDEAFTAMRQLTSLTNLSLRVDEMRDPARVDAVLTPLICDHLTALQQLEIIGDSDRIGLTRHTVWNMINLTTLKLTHHVGSVPTVVAPNLVELILEKWQPALPARDPANGIVNHNEPPPGLPDDDDTLDLSRILAGCPRLKRLQFVPHELTGYSEVIFPLPTSSSGQWIHHLTHLQLKDMYVEPDHIGMLLQTCHQLTHVHLWINQWEPEGVPWLHLMCCAWPQLIQLYLRCDLDALDDQPTDLVAKWRAFHIAAPAQLIHHRLEELDVRCDDPAFFKDWWLPALITCVLDYEQFSYDHVEAVRAAVIHMLPRVAPHLQSLTLLAVTPIITASSFIVPASSTTSGGEESSHEEIKDDVKEDRKRSSSNGSITATTIATGSLGVMPHLRYLDISCKMATPEAITSLISNASLSLVTLRLRFCGLDHAVELGGGIPASSLPVNTLRELRFTRWRTNQHAGHGGGGHGGRAGGARAFASSWHLMRTIWHRFTQLETVQIPDDWHKPLRALVKQDNDNSISSTPSSSSLSASSWSSMRPLRRRLVIVESRPDVDQ